MEVHAHNPHPFVHVHWRTHTHRIWPRMILTGSGPEGSLTGSGPEDPWVTGFSTWTFLVVDFDFSFLASKEHWYLCCVGFVWYVCICFLYLHGMWCLYFCVICLCVCLSSFEDLPHPSCICWTLSDVVWNEDIFVLFVCACLWGLVLRSFYESLHTRCV